MAGYVSPVSGLWADNSSNVFGASRDHGTREHAGNDLHAPNGSTAVAAIGGTVQYVGKNQGYAYNAVVLGDDGNAYRYATHGPISVKEGQRVETGQPIGTIAKGHLHFEVIPSTSPAYAEMVANPGQFVSTSWYPGQKPRTVDPAVFFGVQPGAKVSMGQPPGQAVAASPQTDPVVRAKIAQLQQEMTDKGFYSGPINGEQTPEFTAASLAYQGWTQPQPMGVLPPTEDIQPTAAAYAEPEPAPAPTIATTPYSPMVRGRQETPGALPAARLQSMVTTLPDRPIGTLPPALPHQAYDPLSSATMATSAPGVPARALPATPRYDPLSGDKQGSMAVSGPPSASVAEPPYDVTTDAIRPYSYHPAVTEAPAMPRVGAATPAALPPIPHIGASMATEPPPKTVRTVYDQGFGTPTETASPAPSSELAAARRAAEPPVPSMLTMASAPPPPDITPPPSTPPIPVTDNVTAMAAGRPLPQNQNVQVANGPFSYFNPYNDPLAIADPVTEPAIDVPVADAPPPATATPATTAPTTQQGGGGIHLAATLQPGTGGGWFGNLFNRLAGGGGSQTFATGPFQGYGPYTMPGGNIATRGYTTGTNPSGHPVLSWTGSQGNTITAVDVGGGMYVPAI